MAERHVRRVGVVFFVVLALACAPTQMVPVTMEPVPIAVFVDGRRLPGTGSQKVELKSDRAHVFLFKKEGYRSQQVVLRSEPGPDRPRLQPEEIGVQLIPIEGRKPEIAVSLDPTEERGAE